MTTKRTMDDVRAATPGMLAKMTPVKIDELFAALYDEYNRLDRLIDSAWDGLYRAVGEKKVSRYNSMVWPYGRDELETKARKILEDGTGVDLYRADITKALTRLDSLGEEMLALNRGARPTLLGEWERRDGWSRFFLVQDGHIHRGGHAGWDSDCHSLRSTTLLYWQPELSGKTEQEAVTALGPTMCTICFPSAPLEWTRGKTLEEQGFCSGSGQSVTVAADRLRRKNWMTCPVCGKEEVFVTGNRNLRKHKPKNKPAAAEPAITETPKPTAEAQPKETPAPPASATKPGGAPATMAVSRFLADAGFKRSTETSRDITGGYKVSGDGRGSVSITHAENLDDSIARRNAEGAADFSEVTPDPHAPEYIKAYADALGARYSVSVSNNGRHISLAALPEAPKAAKGRPLAKAVKEALAAGSLPIGSGSGLNSPRGCYVVQEADHVRIGVRPWEYTGKHFTQDDVDHASGAAEAALKAAGYVFTRSDNMLGSVIKVTGKGAPVASAPTKAAAPVLRLDVTVLAPDGAGGYTVKATGRGEFSPDTSVTAALAMFLDYARKELGGYGVPQDAVAGVEMPGYGWVYADGDGRLLKDAPRFE
ncbi:SPOR domain-containing protein [Streptomyces sp. NPDC059761]|uniref:SPOR domain-containing protein n=1 Tax=Streptomyces sp. NPDC059761 TaxID=3346937 RepID=UPI0036502673